MRRDDSAQAHPRGESGTRNGFEIDVSITRWRDSKARAMVGALLLPSDCSIACNCRSSPSNSAGLFLEKAMLQLLGMIDMVRF